MSTIQRLAAIDTELDAIATRIEALRRRRETLITERQGIINRHGAEPARLTVPAKRKAASR